MTRYPYLGDPAQGQMRSTSVAATLSANTRIDLRPGFYLRPAVSLGLGQVSSNALVETGTPLALALERSTDRFAVLTPALEIGFNTPLDLGCELACSKLTGGLTVAHQQFLGNRSASARGGFAAADANARPFHLTDGIEDSWNLEARLGLQLSPLTSINVTADRQWTDTTSTSAVGFSFDHAF